MVRPYFAADQSKPSPVSDERCISEHALFNPENVEACHVPGRIALREDEHIDERGRCLVHGETIDGTSDEIQRLL